MCRSPTTGGSTWRRSPRLLTERTKLVAVAAVSNTLGTINPVAEIVRQAHAAGALVLVDAAQSVPHMTVDVQALDCDFLAFSGHKMLGPSGVGVLYGKESLLDAMPPFLGGGSMINEVRLEQLHARRAAGEVRSRHAADRAGDRPGRGDRLPRSAWAWTAIHRHEHELVRYAYEGLSQVEDLRILGPAPEHRAGLVSFVFERIHAHEFAQVLNDQFGVAVRAGHHCTQPLHAAAGHHRQHAGEFLSLQHAGGSRPAARRRGRGAANVRPARPRARSGASRANDGQAPPRLLPGRYTECRELSLDSRRRRRQRPIAACPRFPFPLWGKLPPIAAAPALVFCRLVVRPRVLVVRRHAMRAAFLSVAAGLALAVGGWPATRLQADDEGTQSAIQLEDQQAAENAAGETTTAGPEEEELSDFDRELISCALLPESSDSQQEAEPAADQQPAISQWGT